MKEWLKSVLNYRSYPINKTGYPFLDHPVAQRFSTCGPRTPGGPRGASKGSTEVRWLSRSRVFQRVCELRDELLIFQNQHNESMAHFFTGETWVARLAYLADILKILNSLNLSLQGLDTRSENA